MKLRDNKGVTLVELMVSIAIGTMVVLAVTTVMLLGLKIYSASNKVALKQQKVRMAITVMENLATEASNVNVNGDVVYFDSTEGEEQEPLLQCVNGIILTNAGAAILEDVDDFEAQMDEDLLTIKFKVNGIEAPYSFSVHCPVKSAIQAESTGFSMRQESPEEILTNAIHDEALTPGVRAFLKVLESQVGSEGQILTEDGAGEYYSSWYIGGYEGSDGWSEETPWCGCFISWALEECSGYIQGQTPRFANVDKFWAEFVTSDSWKTTDPQPGEIIFFDWILDGKMNPEHVGVVFAADEKWIYTVEGNSNNLVKICKYSVENPYILGFGDLNWT